jgi:hypothetical protein
MVDGLEMWWVVRKDEIANIKKLVINMDNGLECSGRRNQFLQRITEFADSSGLEIRLIYYPPYHSKYNSIERYWAGLERSWNGYLLDSMNMVIRRAKSFAWREMAAMVTLVDVYYQKGIKLSRKEKAALEKRLERSPSLRSWNICIKPKKVYL